nr:hypothetical protein [Actinoplanes toevensis]
MSATPAERPVVGAEAEVGPQRDGDLLLDELAQRAAVDPAHQFVEQVTVDPQVVAGRGARLPPRRLSSQPGRRRVVVVQLRDAGRGGQPGHPGRV